MKTYLFAAALASVLVLPALAEDKPADSFRPLGHEAHAKMKELRNEARGEGKDIHEKFKGERKEMRDDHRAEGKAHHEKCKADMKAAEGDAAKDAILTKCRAEADTMRKKFFDEKGEQIDKRRGEMDKHRDDMRAKRDALKKELPAAE